MSALKKQFTALQILFGILILCNFFLWGLPSLLGNRQLADLVQAPYPDMTYYLRMVGVLTITFGCVYIPAFLNPGRYSFLITIAILDTGFTAVVSLAWLLQNRETPPPIIIFTTIICFVLFAGFLLFHPVLRNWRGTNDCSTRR